jgi:hypothetical protein
MEKESRQMTRPVMIAKPCTDMMPTVSAICHSRLRLPPGSETHWRAGGGTIASKREVLVQEFLSQPRFGSLLWLDSDMTYPPDLVERLQQHRLPVVSGMCFQRGAPYHPTALATEHLLFTEFDGLVHECWATGTGCLLIQREVIEALKRPYFEDGHFGAAGMGEDYFHCRRIADAGFKIHLDTGLRIGHVGQVEVDIEFLEMWLTYNNSKGRQRPAGCAMTITRK